MNSDLTVCVNCLSPTISSEERRQFNAPCFKSIEVLEDRYNVERHIHTNLSLPHSFKETFSKVKTEYITWINDDDIFIDEGGLDECYDKVKNGGFIGAATSSYKIDHTGKIIEHMWKGQPYTTQKHRIYPTFVHEMTVLRTEDLLSVMDDNFLSFYSLHWWYATQMIALRGNFFKSFKLGYGWRKHGKNSSTFNMNVSDYKRLKNLISKVKV
jgi:hypothetical protein